MKIADTYRLDTRFDSAGLMHPVFSGEISLEESVMFLDQGEERTLLYPIERVLSVTSHDQKETYEEGKDYAVVNGKLKVLPSSRIPCITSARYYNHAGSILTTLHEGKEVPTYWGQDVMAPYQVDVTYTHTSPWTGFVQESYAHAFKKFLSKLEAGQDVTVFFYGDSITNGANASFLANMPPYQGTYSMLFTEALATHFGYTVRYVKSELKSTPPVPTEDFAGGTRGTITYINTAVGGWSSRDGLKNADAYVKDTVSRFGCDLFVVAYGMNDRTLAPEETASNQKTVVDAVRALAPDTATVFMATMVPNPDGIGWYGNQDRQEAVLLAMAEKERALGAECAVCRMTSTSLAVLQRKGFRDYAGNNINHPNDYFSRIYAQTLLQTVTGLLYP